MLTSTPLGDTALFIVTTPTKQSVEGERKHIRSRVMRGKNCKKLPSRPSSWITGNSTPTGTTSSTRITNAATLSIPAKVGHGLSCAAFPAEMSPGLLDLIWKFHRATSRPDLGLVFDSPSHPWFDPILNDVACLHFTVFVAMTYRDYVQGRAESSHSALAHFAKALGMIRQRLDGSDSEGSTCDSTILVVVGFITSALTLGDLKAALGHIRGLQQMVMLRGGILAFQANKTLQTKILCADLGVALSAGCKPRFFSDTISWGSYIAPKPRASTSLRSCRDPLGHASGLAAFLGGLDTKLRLIWDDISELARAVNVATQCKLSIDGELYRDGMISIHYRLVNLCLDASSTDEVIRLALLTFASTIFLGRCGVETHHENLARSLQGALSRLSCEPKAVPAQLVLWLYAVCRISALGGTEQGWIRAALAELLRSMDLKSWDDVKLRLKCVLWVDVLLDHLTKKVVIAAMDRDTQVLI
ncbi:hypothetical protein GGR52DRAFT_148908 [Hypoxylon sp. FL1284]|nr:hypothetical protein GGR52DRAFT_148908 [Hypoxylon sp. FL1284]